MRPSLKLRVATLCALAGEFGIVVASVGVSRGGSVYAVLTRPWIASDSGFRVRLSDHVPASGLVAGWVDFRTTRRGLLHLRRYLAAKANRGRTARGAKGVEGAGRGGHGVSLLARAGDGASTQQHRSRAKPEGTRRRTAPRGVAVVMPWCRP